MPVFFVLSILCNDAGNIILGGIFQFAAITCGISIIPTITKGSGQYWEKKKRRNKYGVAVMKDLRHRVSRSAREGEEHSYVLKYEFDAPSGDTITNEDIIPVDTTITELLQPGCKIPVMYEEADPENVEYIKTSTRANLEELNNKA